MFDERSNMSGTPSDPHNDDSSKIVPPRTSASFDIRSGGFLLLVPMALAYTWFARDLAGPGYTTAPNQNAMLVFGLFAFAWPILAMASLCVLWWLFRVPVNGRLSLLFGLACWLVSSTIPFWIGMK